MNGILQIGLVVDQVMFISINLYITVNTCCIIVITIMVGMYFSVLMGLDPFF